MTRARASARPPSLNPAYFVARPEGFEPPTSGLENGDRRSSTSSSSSQTVGIAQGRSRAAVQPSQAVAALREHFATRLLPDSGPRSGAPSKLLTVKEAATALRVCTATVYALVHRGELPHLRISNSIRVVIA